MRPQQASCHRRVICAVNRFRHYSHSLRTRLASIYRLVQPVLLITRIRHSLKRFKLHFHLPIPR
uniref:Uncharacterized protein n=1 Tax=Parascaris equorum TaxID=6256 RepID=A0A914RYV7_PAREQ